MSFFFSSTGKASQKKTVSLQSVETCFYPSTPFSHHSMDTLLRFTIENFRSIAEQKSIVLTPDSQVEELAENVAVQGEHRYFRTAAIYGANSSGKSNVVRGLAMMKHLVDSSVKMNNGEALTYEPFALNAEKAQSPTLYELDFLTGGEHYRYGFSHTAQEICEEWLIRIDEAGKATKLFDRDEEGIGVNEEDFAEGKGLEERANDNRLFLSLVGQLGGKISNQILGFFSDKLDVLSGLKTEHYQAITEMCLLDHSRGAEALTEFLHNAQLGFSRLVVRFLEDGHIKMLSQHGVYDQEGNRIGEQNFDFKQMESVGTQKLFDMAGPIFDTLHNGGVLIIDELDAKMHPLLTQELVALFNDSARNPRGAQLIFTTHDTNLLSAQLLRQDQIWFTEKDAQERTDLYNMAQMVLPDGTRPSHTTNMERNYIAGRYGAIPYFSPLI